MTVNMKSEVNKMSESFKIARVQKQGKVWLSLYRVKVEFYSLKTENILPPIFLFYC
jgi:hypothetical protein